MALLLIWVVGILARCSPLVPAAFTLLALLTLIVLAAPVTGTVS